jgi:hypothetical protein
LEAFAIRRGFQEKAKENAFNLSRDREDIRYIIRFAGLAGEGA